MARATQETYFLAKLLKAVFLKVTITVLKPCLTIRTFSPPSRATAPQLDFRRLPRFKT